MAADCRIPNGQDIFQCRRLYQRMRMKPSQSQHQQTQSVNKTTFLMGHKNEPNFVREVTVQRQRHLKGLKNNRTLLLSGFLVVFSLLLDQHRVCSLFIDCSSLQHMSKCYCSKEDFGGWRIECPNEVRSRPDVELKVQRLDSSNSFESALIIQCADGPDSKDRSDPWSFIQKMDFSVQQINSKIVRLDINYCPPVQDGWRSLLKNLNLTGSDIRRFSFITENRQDSASTVPIPTNFFEEMPNLGEVNLRDNKLTSIPDLSSLQKLTGVNLRDNEITSVPTGAFTKNTQLLTVALTNNKIDTVSPGAFPESLEHLELNKNEISSLNASIFANLPNLKRLFLNSNKLDDVAANSFDGMPSLEELYVYNSQMTQFPDFQRLDKLTKLTISNAILYRNVAGQKDVTTTLPPDYLPENTLVLKNLPSMENLVLRLNHFASLPVLENLPKLTTLDLQRNDMTEIEPGSFAGLPALKTLILFRNKLKKLGSIRAPSLIELDLSANSLEELRNDMFQFLGALKKLNLAKNQIRSIAPRAFEQLSFLEELDLSHNHVTFSSPPPVTSGGSNIPNEYLFFGAIDQSPLRFSTRLKKLLLSHNEIETLGYSDWSQVFTQINEIDLSYNKIERITAHDLNFISGNLTLNLEHNQISTVDMVMSIILESNASPEKEERVFLNGNPLHCDCLAYGLKNFNSESYHLQIKNLTCASPPELSGEKLVNVDDLGLLCNLEPVYGCPPPCDCRKRPVDKTVIIDCSSRNLTSEDIPKLNSLRGVYALWAKELDLSDNKITDFNNTDYLKKFLNKTKHVNLSGNQLTSTHFLEHVSDSQPTSFSIAENPFPCDNCVGFQIPWRAFPNRISDLANVTCLKETSSSYSSLTGGKKFELVFVQQKSKEFESFCAPKLSVVVVLPLVIAVIFLSCLSLGLFVTIRYGWAIKAYLYSKGWDWCLFWERDLDADDEENSEKLYDAFVSYSSKDDEFVTELVKRLEDNEGFKLCLHQRDWIPGDWIPDQIVRSVDKSRRTIVILSNNFLESVWSRLEFKAAHAQALKERSSRVILILLGEDIKQGDVQDDDLKIYMKMNTFMKWNDPLFWHRLKYALPHKRSNLGSTEEQKQNQINKLQQREQAIKLEKWRVKLEQNV